MHPTPYDVTDYLGRDASSGDQAKIVAHIDVATAMVKAYTRHRGFDETGTPNAELEKVIITTTARSLDNPTNLRGQGIDDATVQYQIVSGWTLAELAVLNRYRKRAM